VVVGAHHGIGHCDDQGQAIGAPNQRNLVRRAFAAIVRREVAAVGAVCFILHLSGFGRIGDDVFCLR